MSEILAFVLALKDKKHAAYSLLGYFSSILMLLYCRDIPAWGIVLGVLLNAGRTWTATESCADSSCYHARSGASGAGWRPSC